jgi:hypothetical protein
LLRVDGAVVRVGQFYRVRGYYTGDFIGEVENVGEIGQTIVLRVTDSLRKSPTKNKCPWPYCIADDGHDGDHEFSEVTPGQLIEVPYGLVKWEAVDGAI